MADLNIFISLKLPNLLKHNGIVKIADFGLSKQLSERDLTARTQVGTPLTSAPEILEGKEHGIAADMYSLGVIFY